MIKYGSALETVRHRQCVIEVRTLTLKKWEGHRTKNSEQLITACRRAIFADLKIWRPGWFNQIVFSIWVVNCHTGFVKSLTSWDYMTYPCRCVWNNNKIEYSINIFKNMYFCGGLVYFFVSLVMPLLKVGGNPLPRLKSAWAMASWPTHPRGLWFGMVFGCQ